MSSRSHDHSRRSHDPSRGCFDDDSYDWSRGCSDDDSRDRSRSRCDDDSRERAHGGCEDDSRERYDNDSYHESLWQAVPAGLPPAHFQMRLRFLLGEVFAGERVLDVGCGEGWFASELLDAGASVVGLDVAAEPLRRARARDSRLDLRLAHAAGPWPIEDASVDVVWAGETIEHVADTAGWLSQARRVLVPGGRLLLSTPAHGRLRLLWLACSQRAFAAHFDPLSDHLRFYTRAGLAGLLGEFGFQDISVHGHGGLPGARRVLLARAIRSRW